MDGRFIIIKEKNDRFAYGTDVIVDLATGVQYLYVSAGYGGGLTMLVDPDGRPLLYRNEEHYEQD